MYLHLLNLLTWGSTINGHRSEFVRIVAFSEDIRSFGKPSLFQVAICVASVSNESGSKLSVIGISG